MSDWSIGSERGAYTCKKILTSAVQGPVRLETSDAQIKNYFGKK